MKIILLVYLMIVLLGTIHTTPHTLSKKIWKKNFLKYQNEIEKSCTKSKDIYSTIGGIIIIMLLCNLFSIIMFMIVGYTIATKISIILTSLKIFFILINSWTSVVDLCKISEKRFNEIKFPRFYLVLNLILNYSVCLYSMYMLLK